MTDIATAGAYALGDRTVNRMGYGAMQLAGPGVFGPPKDHAEALAVLREAIAQGVNHIDTSDYYGPYVTNQIIREALHPYREDLVIVTKLGAKRGDDASWNPALTPADLTQGLHDNLRISLAPWDVVNLRVGGIHGPVRGYRAAVHRTRRTAKGLIRHLGLSNVTSAQVKECRAIAPVVCVQNLYNVAQRGDDALIDELADLGIAYVPFFPLGGFFPLQAEALSQVAADLGATPLQVALAWLLQRSTNILLIPGTSSRAHLAENLAAAELSLPADALAKLETIGAPKT